MYSKIIPHIAKGLALCVLLLSTWNLSIAQTCGDGSTADVTLTGIGEVTVTGADNSGEANDAYDQALADAAESAGLATCAGTCTVGTCEMQFKKYKRGSSRPSSTTNENGDYVFSAPSNGDQSFKVHCPCVVEAAIELEILEGPIQHHNHGEGR